MAGFTSEQRHLTFQGRSFHFVSQEGSPGDDPRDDATQSSTWYLMVEGHRCSAFPFDPLQSLSELDLALERWAGDNAMGPVERHP